ncbi:HEPN domain-containing protein [Azospirillum brasilense]|uniref:HEPN domain-containing protein n=1 Tax=Azospirillum brasilense TaxID=192 RepID=A0A560BN43_AZOBR|nr:HEPN domain-containing protein [Azospirillum brasilense]TWA74038.1 HEPN domain-containing protein [Azospirillum brasilense]
MKYEEDFPGAARRHLHDGKLLAESNRLDNAGYHFGLAAECALKAAMRSINIPTKEFMVGEKDAYYIHFPKLKNIALKHTGRISKQVSESLNKSSFMQNWEIRMRYSKKAVEGKQCEAWANQAEEFVKSCFVVGL